ncbi:hypothetical protein CVU76_02370 [Candidatus Dojkabacteria bacterium HGW-Dojkabacteria-1]|uniref:site-specific DNA-methyltransferase (adenine-specific) n=1 Tax=Candidatus Dojkabacteria bacterium HGW-Dojkabacteria-1 TaxID=2013761 RepID=A0A2N2F3W2_9BACT|nr:MAG: hypothetical protein CVU76_02370 [Candidatus Dojkabacteria bacterium HGW-Dojkabacteria-1]
MNLINKKLLQQKYTNFEFPTGKKLEEINTLIDKWQRALKDSDLENTKEKSIQGKFLQTFFENILNYDDVTSAEQEYTLIQHPRIENNVGEPDGSLGFFTKDNKDTRVVIELKDAKTDLDKKQHRDTKQTPVDQAFNYASKEDKCKWIIVSNFKEIRLYSKSRSQEYFERFMVLDLLDEQEFKRFYFLLSKDNLIKKEDNSVVDVLSLESNQQEQDITNDYYAKYKEVRLGLLNHLLENNKGISAEVLLEKTQKLLDRIVFTLFCEDTTELLPYEIVKNTYERALSSFASSDERVWNEFKGLFKSIDEGNSRVTPPINAYNGGLFKKDEILDNLIILDSFWKRILELAEYDYQTDINVNILGHIFEQSISDLERIKENVMQVKDSDNRLEMIEDLTVTEKKGRRKKDGIFYTPEYITKYIVENTVGRFLEENPDKLNEIKILDPACGSGAILNQAHTYLKQEYARRFEEKLQNIRESGKLNLEIDDYDPASVNNGILLNNLFGVDLNKESVEITKLALWLKTAKNTEPLQNLDKNIKCGNSLIDDPAIAGDKAFNWGVEYKDIIDNGGFDVIVANPPYIKEYTNKTAFTGLHDGPYYQGKMDIWTYFACLSIDLLKENGYLSFIAPNNWITNAGASIFREKILNEGEIISYFDFGGFQVFKDAGIQTMIFVFKKEKNVKNRYKVEYTKILDKQIGLDLIQLVLNDRSINYSDSIKSIDATIDREKIGNGNIVFSDEKFEKVIDKISKSRTFTLNDNEVAQGIVGAPDECFIVDDLTKFNISEREFIKPFYTNVSRYSVGSTNSFIIYLSSKNFDDKKLEDFPNLYTHFNKYKDVLIDAKIKYKTPNKPYYYLHRERNEQFFKAGDKIVCGVRVKYPTFFYTISEYYGSRALNFIVTDRINLKYLTALLNSTISNFWFRNRGKLLGELLQVDKGPLLLFPIKDTNKEDILVIEQYVFDLESKYKDFYMLNEETSVFLGNEYHLDLKNILEYGWNQIVEILDKKKTRLSIEEKEKLHNWIKDKQKKLKEMVLEIKNIESEIDTILYKIYDLSEEEIQIVESFKV